MSAQIKEVLQARELSKIYRSGEVEVQALRGVNLDLSSGELIVLLGASGSGKSTLLNILGGLDTPTSGEVRSLGQALTAFDDTALTRYRREHVGFVFQFYNLIPSLTALENVALVTEIARRPMPPEEALTLVGLGERLHHFPAQLSGGEQQRVAIARAIAKRPDLLLCDEPTGALDSPTAVLVLQAIERIHAEGFIGRYLVRELLARLTGPVYVLVRKSGVHKLEELRQWWGPQAERVIAIEGDLREQGLGVTAAERARIGQPIDHLFHLGALYDIEASDEQLALANVQGTRHALEFAREMGARRFHHVSSIAAAGLYDGMFTEDMFEEACYLEHPYFRTKHDAEAMVRRQRHVPWRIYRPGMVIGDSHTGHITKVDGPYYFFMALQIMRRHVPAWFPTIGFEGGYVNLVPVDYVVAAMVHLSQLPDQDFRCFHLIDPHPRHAGEVLNLFARAGHAPLMGLRVDTELLRSLPIDLSSAMSAYEPLRAIVEELLDDLQLPRSVLTFVNMPTLFDNRRTRTLLEGSDVTLPRLEDYGWKIWDYWERHLDPDLMLDRSLAGRVANKRVLITGGSSGIGRATALRLADAGATVIIAARDAERLTQTQAEIRARGGTAHTYVCDITDEVACDDFIRRLIDEHGGVDILINNAGHSIRRAIAASYQRLHDFERLMKLNYFAAVRLTLALLPGMEARRNGQVIMISSIGVLSNAPRFSAYAASKAAIETFARCAASEYRDRGVRFSVINMPLVRTRMIAPTTSYSRLPALSPERAAELVIDAVVHQSPRIVSRLGMLARLLELFAPRIADTINSAGFRMYPDSAAALGASTEAPPTDGTIAFAKVMHGLHW